MIHLINILAQKKKNEKQIVKLLFIMKINLYSSKQIYIFHVLYIGYVLGINNLVRKYT